MLSTLIVGVAIFLLIGKPISAINMALIEILGSMSGSNGALLGAMAEGILMPYAAFASVKMVSGFAITASTKLFKQYFTKEEKEAGNSTWILVLAGITEGAIPFMMADPVRVIPSLYIGSAVTGAIIGATGIGLDVPGAGIFFMFLLKDGMGIFLNALIWFFAAVAGALISMVILVALRKAKLNKK